MPNRLSLPGFVTAHSHAFQRALRGQAQGEDFWAWRDAMLALAESLTPDGVRASYEATYREMRAAGYTAVGEFHYVGLAEAKAAAEAAEAAEIELVLLLSAYGRGGLRRFRQDSVQDYLRRGGGLPGVWARVGGPPPPLRGCSPPWVGGNGRYSSGGK